MVQFTICRNMDGSRDDPTGRNQRQITDNNHLLVNSRLWHQWIHLLNRLTDVVNKLQFSSVAQSCPTLCDPMNHSTQGLPVHHHLPEFTQTRALGLQQAPKSWNLRQQWRKQRSKLTSWNPISHRNWLHQVISRSRVKTGTKMKSLKNKIRTQTPSLNPCLSPTSVV